MVVKLRAEWEYRVCGEGGAVAVWCRAVRAAGIDESVGCSEDGDGDGDDDDDGACMVGVGEWLLPLLVWGWVCGAGGDDGG